MSNHQKILFSQTVRLPLMPGINTALWWEGRRVPALLPPEEDDLISPIELSLLLLTLTQSAEFPMWTWRHNPRSITGGNSHSTDLTTKALLLGKAKISLSDVSHCCWDIYVGNLENAWKVLKCIVSFQIKIFSLALAFIAHYFNFWGFHPHTLSFTILSVSSVSQTDSFNLQTANRAICCLKLVFE